MKRNGYLGMAVAILAALTLFGSESTLAQRGGGAPGGRGGAAAGDATLPDAPVAVTLPSFREVTGPGAMYNSSTAQWPGYDMEHFDYEMREYFVSGMAAGEPYTTRLVIRKPKDDARLSGVVVAEPMHPIGGAHAFEYNSVYIMDSGHVAAEIATTGLNNFTSFNAERYKDLSVSNPQANEILAQVGALVRSDTGPLAGTPVRTMVLWGTSASSGILVRYLPAHRVYRTPAMELVYDGFMPTSNGSQIDPVDVPIIQVPTQHEFSNVATAQQDGDAPGEQFRVYEFVGLSHLMSRNNAARVTQSDCRYEMSMFPLEAYMSVALHHLIEWVDQGTVPPKAERVLMDMYTPNDGSLMLLDDVGNARGGIRSPYVDVPTAKIIAGNEPSAVEPEGAPGQGPRLGPGLLCRLSAYVEPLSATDLRARYGTPENYVREFEAKLVEAERAGWSLPVYHDLILADARAVRF